MENLEPVFERSTALWLGVKPLGNGVNATPGTERAHSRGKPGPSIVLTPAKKAYSSV